MMCSHYSSTVLTSKQRTFFIRLFFVFQKCKKKTSLKNLDQQKSPPPSQQAREHHPPPRRILYDYYYYYDDDHDDLRDDDEEEEEEEEDDNVFASSPRRRDVFTRVRFVCDLHRDGGGGGTRAKARAFFGRGPLFVSIRAIIRGYQQRWEQRAQRVDRKRLRSHVRDVFQNRSHEVRVSPRGK